MLSVVLVAALVGLVVSPGPSAGADGTVDVSDTTGTFTVSVPASWGDVQPQPLDYEEDGLVPNLVVAADAGAFLDGTGEGANLLVVPGPSTARIYTQEYLDAFVADPACVQASPATESSNPAMPRAIVGTWQCGGLTLTIAWGATADDAYLVALSTLTADAAVGAAVVASLRHDGAGGGPPTTVPTETAGLTVTDSGDPATAVVLRRPRTVGARSNVVIETDNAESDDFTFVDSGRVESTAYSSSFRASGVYEVTDEEPDGSYAVEFTPSAITGEYTTNDPDETSFTGGFTPLVGVPMATWYGSDGMPFGFINPDDVAVTEEQLDWMLLVPVDGFSLPLAPVGVGATWTAEAELTGPWWFLARTPATYRLESIEGDRFTVSMSLSLDISTLEHRPVVLEQSGTFSRTMWLAGSLTQPGIELVIEESASVYGEFGYGATSATTWTSRRTFTEVPAPAA